MKYPMSLALVVLSLSPPDQQSAGRELQSPLSELRVKLSECLIRELTHRHPAIEHSDVEAIDSLFARAADNRSTPAFDGRFPVERRLQEIAIHLVEQPDLYQKIRDHYLTPRFPGRRGGPYPSSHTIASEYLTPEFCLAWEYFLLVPAWPQSPRTRACALTALTFMKATDAIPTLVYFHSVLTDELVRFTASEGYQSSTFSTLGANRSTEALEAMLACLRMSRAQLGNQKAKSEGLDPDELVFQILSARVGTTGTSWAPVVAKSEHFFGEADRVLLERITAEFRAQNR